MKKCVKNKEFNIKKYLFVYFHLFKPFLGLFLFTRFFNIISPSLINHKPKPFKTTQTMMKEFLITVAAVIVAVVLVEQGKKMLAKKGA